MGGSPHRPVDAGARRRRARRRQRWTAAVAVLCLITAAWVGRRLGVAEALVGGLLGVAALGTLSALVATLARSRGVRWPEATAWAVVVFAASASPFLASVRPGPLLGGGTLEAEGGSILLEPGRATTAKVSVTAVLPEGGSVAFALRSGAALGEGSLARGTMRWVAGSETRRYHEDRTSVLLDLPLAAGARRLDLERVSRQGIPLQVAVYDSALPGVLLLVAGFCVLAALGWRMAVVGGDRDVVMCAAMSVVAGLGSAAIATPDRAFAPVLAGLLLGLVVGLPLGAAAASAAAWARSRGSVRATGG